jgi:Ca2+-dependent lipid-binding protein
MELRVRVRDASSLPCPQGFVGLDTPSPYIQMLLVDRNVGKRTSVKRLTTSPHWEEDFIFDIVSYNSDVLKFVVLSEQLGRDARFSKLLIRVSAIPPGQIVDQWYRLRAVTLNNAARVPSSRQRCYRYISYQQDPGQLHLGLQVGLKGGIPWRVVPVQLFQVVVTLIEAREMPKMDTFGTCDPVCFITLVGSRLTYKSKVCKKTYDPLWNEMMAFALTNPHTDVLRFFVKDNDLISDDPIGTLDLPLAHYYNRAESDLWRPLVGVKGVEKAGHLHYKLKVVAAAPSSQYAATETGATTKSGAQTITERDLVRRT